MKAIFQIEKGLIKPRFAKLRNDLPDEDSDGDYDPVKAKIEEEKEEQLAQQ